MNTLKYILLLFALLPFSPFLFFEGKKVKRTMPDLPEPTDTQGVSGHFSKKIKLLALGESTIAGVGVESHRDGLTGQLADGLSRHFSIQIEWEVFAKSGLTAAVLSQKILEEKINTEPNLILIGLGGNDTFRLTPPPKWRKDILSFISNLRAISPSPPVVFANLPPTQSFPAFSPLLRFFLGRQTELLRRELISLTADLPAVFFCEKKIVVDEWLGNSEGINDLFSDGVHPSPRTYRLWAEEITGFIIEKGLFAHQ